MKRLNTALSYTVILLGVIIAVFGFVGLLDFKGPIFRRSSLGETVVYTYTPYTTDKRR